MGGGTLLEEDQAQISWPCIIELYFPQELQEYPRGDPNFP
jgi:hypothetical protein